jgi:gas vesicle protein
LNILVPVIMGIAVGLLFAVRRGRKPRDIARSLSPADRQFIADQIEPITKLPLNTAADEDAWLAATRAAMQRLKERFPDVASVVPEQVYHYFDDADIHRKEPSYRVASKARILEFIRLLREEPAKT